MTAQITYGDGGTNRSITGVYYGDGATLRNIKAIYYGDGATIRQVFASLSATLSSTDAVVVYRSAIGGYQANATYGTRGTATATPIGGTSPFTYSWSILSSPSPGTSTLTNATSQTCLVNVNSDNPTGTLTLQCVVTDASSNTFTGTVNVNFST